MTDDAVARIGRLAAVARGLEREGAYNGAKLVRGALERELVRYADAAAPAGRQDLASAVDAVAGLVSAHAGIDLREPLAGVAAAVREDRTITLEDVPPVRVCRVCGELFIGLHTPATCPGCEAPALSFREILPVWYLEPAEPGTILAALAAGPGHVAAAVRGLDDAVLGRPPAPREWSARDTLAHLVFTEELLARRVERLLTEDDPDLGAWSVPGDATSDEGSGAAHEPASALLAAYRALRHATIERLRVLGDAGWGRGGRHAEWGHVTVLSQAAYFARHEASHLAQLVAACEGRLPGRAGRPGATGVSADGASRGVSAAGG